MIKMIKSVLWGFLGVRKKEDFDDDIKNIKPIQLIIAGFVTLIFFVISLILVIKYVVL